MHASAEPSSPVGALAASEVSTRAPYRLRTRLLLGTAGGLLGALAFPLAFPFGPRHELLASGVLEPLAFICLVPTLIALRGLTTRKAFGTGFFSGWVFFTAVFWWVNVAMTTFGGMPDYLSVPALLMLSGWCAFHWGLAFALVRFFERRHGWPMGWTIAPVWMATELMRNYFCSGFPWGNLGYSQARDLWLSQIASVGGVYGIAFLVALVNGAFFEIWRARKWRERPSPKGLAGLAAGLLAVSLVYGAVRVGTWTKRIAKAPTVKVAVVQPNIDQKLKNMQRSFSSVVMSAFNPPTSLADAAGAQLIVWPEASFPRIFEKGDDSFAYKGLSQSRYHADLLLGVDVFDPSDPRHGSLNAAWLASPDLDVIGRYVKHHLVPFGEYVPFDLAKILPIDNLVPGTFKPGKTLVPLEMRTSNGRTVKIGTEICYDAIFPEISRTYAREGADILVNMTNDAWYGFSSAPFQFLRMVAMRAVETGRPVARAANTGVSGFVDPLGRVFDTTKVGLVDTEKSSVGWQQLVPSSWRMASLPILHAETVYVAIGDWPSYLAALFCLFGIALGFKKRKGATSRSA